MQKYNLPLGRDLKLSRFQKIKLGLSGKVVLGDKKISQGDEHVIYYAFKCPVHGLQMDYPHGHNDTLTCPECLKTIATKFQNVEEPPKQKTRFIERMENILPTASTNIKSGFLKRNKAIIGISALGVISIIAVYGLYKRLKA